MSFLDPLACIPLITLSRLVVDGLAVVLSVELLVEVVVSERSEELLHVSVGPHSLLSGVLARVALALSRLGSVSHHGVHLGKASLVN